MRFSLLDAAWLLVFGIASSAWCLSAGQQLGATFDEPIYVARGLEFWRTGSHAGLMHLGTMPLPVDVQTLPLYLWERSRGELFDPAADLARILPAARAATLVFWWLLLFYAMRAGRGIAGPWAGRLAVAFLACEPNLLAHASLATTDLAVSACLLGLVYHFRSGREAGWPRRVGVPTLWFAIAVLAKASGLVFGILCLLVVEWERLGRGFSIIFRLKKIRLAVSRDAQAIRWFARHAKPQSEVGSNRCPVIFSECAKDLLSIITFGLVLVFLYCGCDGRPEPSFVAWAHRQTDGPVRQIAVWLAEHLCIFSNAGEGLVRQVKHNLHGHGVYLLGRSDDRSLWYYFPVVLTIKLSLSLLLGVGAMLIFRPRTLVNWAFLAAAALLIFSLTCRVQLGVRLMLPLVVLLTVGLAAAIGTSVQATAGWRRILLLTTTAAGLIWTGSSAVRIWPHGLCYVNELWGGTTEGYIHVSETNYDWGQGLPELEHWRQANGLPALDIWYFGTDPALSRLPLRNVPFHVLPIEQPRDVLAHIRGRYLAVSTTLLYGMAADTPANRNAVEFLRNCRPAARTMTFLIYDFQ